VSEPRGVYLLSAAHAEGFRALSGEADFAGAVGISMAPSPDEVADYVAAATKAREEGRSYVFVLTDRSEVLGVCRLIGVRGVPRLIVAVGQPFRGRGNGSFLVRHVLEFGFENLQLDRVTATGACLRLVSQFGLGLNADGLTRQEWQEARAKTVRESLHPSLIPIFDAELAAGNEVAEWRTGWPDPDSVFVRLRKSFLVEHRDLPSSVTFAESNDPHWWKSEYSSAKPRHILAS
jgi:hypothetical protein